MENKEDILRRGRLSAAKGEEINAFTSSLQADRWIFPADVMVDKAHTAMLAKQGIIGKKDAAAHTEGPEQYRESRASTTWIFRRSKTSTWPSSPGSSKL